MPLYGRRHSKPNPGVGIDWSHPLSQGLVGFYALNEGAGTALSDAAGRLGLAASAVPPAGCWSSGSSGAAYYPGGAAKGYAMATLPPSLWFGWPITIAAAGRWLATPPTFAPEFGLIREDADNAGQAITLECNGTTNFGAAWCSGTTRTEVSTGVAIPIGADWVQSLTVTPTSQRWYLYGARRYTNSAALSNVTWSGTSAIHLGSWDQNANNAVPTPTYSVLYYWAAWWARALADQEHAALAANPWQVFAPPAYRIFGGSKRFRRTLFDRAGSRGVA